MEGKGSEGRQHYAGLGAGRHGSRPRWYALPVLVLVLCTPYNRKGRHGMYLYL
jgi:hypothetical protein